ncbi:MAG: ABC transporter ATP-binding protein [Phyllobacteriaceae bacterium]|nr:ABC transporter ATP-binding protein [Phyllobacteriaceae bacterium]
MINIRNLVKAFGGRTVIDDLNLSIAKTDRIALVGANGAGKTTLFRCLLGHYGYAGDITFSDVPQHRQREVLSRIAFVPQLPPPLRMPVGELLRFSEATAGGQRSVMEKTAMRLGIDLESILSQPFYRLSGGQKQKVLVTIALSRNAQFMIFDEPSANLDPVARSAFIDMLGERSRDCAMLIASHRLEEVAPLVNRVIELDRGRVVLDDAVADRLQAGEHFDCSIVLREPHEPFLKTMKEWGFAASSGLKFTGRVPAAETFRFLSLTSRYAGIIASLSLGGVNNKLN